MQQRDNRLHLLHMHSNRNDCMVLFGFPGFGKYEGKMDDDPLSGHVTDPGALISHISSIS